MEHGAVQRVLRSNAPDIFFDFNQPVQSGPGTDYFACPTRGHDDDSEHEPNVDCQGAAAIQYGSGSAGSMPQWAAGETVHAQAFPTAMMEYAFRPDGARFLRHNSDEYWPLPAPRFVQDLHNYKFDPIEWQSAKYRNYREKSKNNIDKGKNNPWPDDVEYAFQKALRFYGGRGRAKKFLGEKLSGGNEWMSWCIWVQTHEERGRKQISSHLQVLKGKLGNIPEWMKMADAAHKAMRGDGARPSRRSSGSTRHRANVHNTSKMAVAMARLPIMQSNVRQGPIIHSVNFGMYLCSVSETAGSSSPAPMSEMKHLYTRLQTEIPSAPRDCPDHDLARWRSLFPDLQLEDDGGNETPAYLFEAGIRLQDMHWRNTNLQIEFDLIIAQGMEYHDWTIHTEIHGESTAKFKPCRRVPIFEDNHQHLRLYGVQLGASYWADLFGEFLNEKATAMASCDAAQVKAAEAKARNRLENIYAHQQIWALPPGGSRRKCIATLLWKFYPVEKEKAPTTSWHPLFFARSRLRDRLHTDRLALPPVEECTVDPLSDTHLSPECQDENQFDVRDFGSNTASNQLQMPLPGQTLQSTESSPVTELTNDVGSSMSFPSSTTSSAPLLQAGQNISFDPSDLEDVCDPLDPDGARDTQYEFWTQHMSGKPSQGLIYSPDYRAFEDVEGLVFSQDQHNHILAQLPDFQPYSQPRSLQQGNVPDLPSDAHGIIADGEDDGLHTGRSALYHADCRLDPVEQVRPEPPIQSDRDFIRGCDSPLLAPQAQGIGRHPNHVLQLQQFDLLPTQQVKLPAEQASAKALPSSHIGPKDADYGASPEIGAANARTEKEDSTTPNSILPWPHAARQNLPIPFCNHLPAYVSPFSDPPPSPSFNSASQDWQVTEGEGSMAVEKGTNNYTKRSAIDCGDG